MTDTLLIHFDINAAHQATWAMCNAAGELTGKITTGALQELAEFAANKNAILLLNSQCLHINQLKLPTKNLQKIIKAVPYAIEESIAEDVEDFHFVIAKNKHNNLIDVVGIEKQTLQNIIDTFQELQINIEAIIPDALCLAADEADRQWACLNFNTISYLQTDVSNGMVYSHQLLPYLLKNKLEDENIETPDKILFFCEQENNTAFESIVNDDSIFTSRNIEVINIVYNTHPLVVFCGSYKQALALNLLQYDFKPKRKTSGYWRHWKLAASLAVIWLVLQLGLSSVILSDLQKENKITKAEIEKIYKKSFPESKRIVNPRVQMEQKLEQLKNNSGNSNKGFIFLLAESLTSLRKDQKNITIQSLTFRNNRMDIGVDSINLQSIESLNNNLNTSSKIKSEITSSSSEKDKVKGHIRIEGRS